MKQVTIAELRAHLAAWLKRVEKGERVIIRRRGEVIAELIPPTGNAPTTDADDLERRLQALEAEGFLKRGTGKWPKWLLEEIPGDPAPLLEALLAEREEGR
jgi:prevent-host-death family protein